MRRITGLISAAVLVLAVVSCSPTAYVEKDPSVNMGSYDTYAWVDSRASQDNKGSDPTAFAQLSVQNEVNAQLQKKGWRLDNKNPDLLLSYDILVERNVEQRDDPVYSRPVTRYYYNPYIRRWGTIYYPSRFVGYDTYTVPVREATLTLSMMDSRSDKTVWQGWTTQQVSSRVMSKEEVRSSVKSIFKKFE